MKKIPTKWAAAGIIVIPAVLFLIFLLPRFRESPSALDLQIYDYRDTRHLVSLTAKAARLLEKKGAAALEDFRNHPEEWSAGRESYLYVYDYDGVNLFHGGYPELEGENLRDFTDLLGKKVSRQIMDELKNPDDLNPHNWVHYLWLPPGALDPVWKASCNFPADLPDGRRVYVGSGIDNPSQEKEFYRIIVDKAANLIDSEGEAALEILQDPASIFVIYDQGVFVFDRNGTALIDPGLKILTERNLYNYSDITGRHPLRELNGRLEDSPSAWVITMERSETGGRPVKKGVYGRVAEMDGKEVIVGAICPLPEPAWMR
mgnify:CR=1 FL=1